MYFCVAVTGRNSVAYFKHVTVIKAVVQTVLLKLGRRGEGFIHAP